MVSREGVPEGGEKDDWDELRALIDARSIDDERLMTLASRPPSLVWALSDMSRKRNLLALPRGSGETQAPSAPASKPLRRSC